jgi:hypothetical protein
MRYYVTIIPLAVCLLLVGAASLGRCDDAGKSNFFNGKDFQGWEGILEYWKVEDGAIIGAAPPDGLKFNTFLCSKRKYRDFELTFQVRLKEGKGNSGVQIRSEIANAKRFAVRGPQADIAPGYWGSLYGELFGGMMKQAPADTVNKVLKKDDFNDYSVKCVGKHVTITLNGETTVDDDFATMPEEGIIAWQLHQGMPGMEVTFKNIKFKNLSKD